MNLKIKYCVTIKDPQAENAFFPGAVRLDDGRLLLLFASGSDFESSDHRVIQAHSSDCGRNWTIDGCIYDHGKLPFAVPFADYAKPTNLGGDELLAIGYGFLRDKPEMGLSDYAEKYGHFPKRLNTMVFSHDGGKNWSQPEFMNHGYDGLELSGPALHGIVP